jgi:NAD(P)-dependent dehydrogenase (short-subunit alcohol dehydrogenase family)
MSTPQSPIGSGFGAASTATDVIRGIDLRDKVAIVTGGYSGLGRETVRILLEAGARVFVPARDVERAETAFEGVGGAEVVPMDLLDSGSISTFANRFLETGLPLHILVTSAGIMAVPELSRDGRGHELQFATNHLGHFQLATQLWPALKKAQRARVVALSSRGHRLSPVVFDDIDFERRPYDPWAAYGQSKTANILFAVELDRRGEKDGMRAFAVHPGRIFETGLAKHLSQDALKGLGAVSEDGTLVIDPAKGLKTVEQGAATQVWCATSPKLAGLGGVYCEDCDIARLQHMQGEGGVSAKAGPGQAGVWPHAVDRETAARLWSVSEQMLGR